MNKQPVDPEWFQNLAMGADYGSDFIWLAQLATTIDNIANFGCWSPEPFALLWILDATHITVIEKEEKRLTGPKEILEILKQQNPECLEGRSVEFLPPGDMIAAELPFGHFDLAYCERVMTNMEDDQEIQLAIDKMAKVVKPGGWVIAVESMPAKQGNPRPREVFAAMFGKAGLTEERLSNAPEDAYCFRRLSDGTASETKAA